MKSETTTWRDANTITDWEFGQIGRLLCDQAPRDLALKIVRLEGQLEVARELAETASPRLINVWNELRRASDFEGAVMVAPDGAVYRIVKARWEKVSNDAHP